MLLINSQEISRFVSVLHVVTPSWTSEQQIIRKQPGEGSRLLSFLGFGGKERSHARRAAGPLMSAGRANLCEHVFNDRRRGVFRQAPLKEAAISNSDRMGANYEVKDNEKASPPPPDENGGAARCFPPACCSSQETRLQRSPFDSQTGTAAVT